MVRNIHLDHLSVCLSVCVCLSVGRSVGPESVLWQNGWVDPGAVWSGEWGWSKNGCIWWGWLSPKGRGSFSGECGASHYNQWGLCCVVVWKCVNRSSCRLAWWMGWAQALMYKMGSTWLKGRGGFWGCLPVYAN